MNYNVGDAVFIIRGLIEEQKVHCFTTGVTLGMLALEGSRAIITSVELASNGRNYILNLSKGKQFVWADWMIKKCDYSFNMDVE